MDDAVLEVSLAVVFIFAHAMDAFATVGLILKQVVPMKPLAQLVGSRGPPQRSSPEEA